MTGAKLHKQKKRICGILLIVTAFIIMQLPVAEADAATSASDFKIQGSTLVKYRGTEKNVSVPDTVETIGESAFEGNTDIELVVLPKSVKQIEAYAFWGCSSLDTVVLGTGLKEVGDYAFANCKGLEQMTVPVNVRSIGIQAFVDCVNMKDITIPPEVTQIHETAFDGCYRLTIHCEPGSAADQYAQIFYEKQKEMPEYEDVPEYQTEIGGAGQEDKEDPGNDPAQQTNAPGQESAETGNMLGSTRVVGNQAVVFIDNTSPVVFEKEVDSAQSNMEEPELLLPETGGQTEGQPGKLPKYTIVDGTLVADQAYYRNKTLDKVTLPEGIEEIGQFSFARSSVSRIMMPEGLKNICYGAFYHCGQLTEVTLPESVEVIEPKAFSHTAWVEDFLEKGESDFLISGGILVAYRGNAPEVVVPDGVRVIAGEAFLDHGEITGVSFPDTLVSIGEGAFQDCAALAGIQFGQSSLREIKDRAFAGCSLESVTVPAAVETLGLKVFDDGVEVIFAGGFSPESTYEASAQRLSNEKYRGCMEETQEPGVTVSGLAEASASLEGAARAYTLKVDIDGERSSLQKAYERSRKTELPENTLVYELQLCDNSGIPLTKLGKQLLTVNLPVPADMSGEEIQVYTVDRNGQLEEVKAERLLSDGVEILRFSTNHLSPFGLCGSGEPFDSSGIKQETNSMVSMSAPEGHDATASGQFPSLAAGALLLAGVVLLCWGTKKKNGN